MKIRIVNNWVSFICLLGLASTGFVRRIIFSGAYRDGIGDTYFLGVSRMDWIDAHVIFALIFLVSITLHLVLHRAWIIKALGIKTNKTLKLEENG